eukprot:scaffold4075_cov116-Skeletonema_dohrnii-CCMP3373.AAC.3
MAPAAEKQRNITIVSVLADGMEHHAMNSAAPFDVNGRTVIRHTINISDDSMKKDDIANKDWRIYPSTTIRRLEKNFGLFAHHRETTTTDEERGYHIIIAISSNLPTASGLSTSSCFVTGLFLVLDSHLEMRSSQIYRNAIGTADEEDTIYNLSTYLGNIENGTCYTRQRVKRTGIDATTEERNIVLEGTKNGDGVGTFGGSEDHAAILMGKKRKLTLLSFCPTRPASFAVDQLNNGLTVCNSEDIDTESKDVNQKSELELPSKLVFVIAYSGARAEKAGQGTGASIGYNYASDMASKAFKAYNACSTAAIHDDEQKKLYTLADSIRYERKKQSISHDTSCEDQVKKIISDKVLKGSATVRGEDHATVADFGNLLTKRFEQFYEESEVLVPTAAYCLAESDRLQMLGPIVDKSHRNAVNILKNQIKETAWLPVSARGIEHQLQTKPTLYVDESKKSEQAPRNHERITAFASSAFGAGFGGSCWALVYRDEAEKFLLQWRSAYDEAFPSNGNREFFITEPGPGAFSL